MNVHLIKTPEYKEEDLEDVRELLQSIDGPLQFLSSSYEFDSVAFPFLTKYWDSFRFPGVASQVEKMAFDPKRAKPLSFQELFSLCDHYRAAFRIAAEDFVVLLTERKNGLNWFSNCDERRNIFVHTGDWDYYTKAPAKYPVAYQIVENILQNLMKLSSDQMDSPNIHYEPLGCVNDFCGNKQQIILKLRTGDICHACLSKMQMEQVDDHIIDQAIGLFETIRTQVLFKQGFTRNVRPKPIQIHPNGDIWVGDKKLNLNPMESTLFIFFLRHSQGVSLNDLADHRDELWSIYQMIKPTADQSSIHDLVRPYHEQGTFSVKKSQLNSKLKKELGEPLANFYCLDGGRGEAFKINIQPDMVSMDIRY